ncbi:hypothetical protein OHD16_06855 [Sphingobacterium sp. ML3W]|uniref:hypothetical protein n=1 Tax=Sphingobacterium sp. ML3W TaxID=1538644 RepID=UPI00249C7554|nr:hypothetical protein [Sphingobacterium sp. ML3W]WFA79689.1 hypothetical protein OGI71_27095 [Sphingobacterium sp. ML3W]
MEPKDKATELVEKFYSTYNAELLGLTHARKDAVDNAIIAVKEIIKANPYYFYPRRKVTRVSDHSTKDYWQSVLTELKSM